MKLINSILFSVLTLLFVSLSASAQVTLTSTSYQNSFGGTQLNTAQQLWRRNGSGTALFAQNNALQVQFQPYNAWDEIENNLSQSINISSNPVLQFSIKGTLPANTFFYVFLVDQSGVRSNTGLSVLKAMPSGDYGVFSIDFSSLAVRGACNLNAINRIRFILTNSSGSSSFTGLSGGITLNGLSLGAPLQVAAPFLSISGTPTSFTTAQGQPSATQTLILNGAGLNGSANVTAPSGFEASTSSSGPFSQAISVPTVSGSYASLPIYIRLTGSAQGSFSGQIEFNLLGFAPMFKSVSGTVQSIGNVFTLTPSSLLPFSSTLELGSTFQTFTLSAQGLTAPVLVQASPNFQVSNDPSFWLSNLTLSPTNGNLNNITLYVRYLPTTLGSHTGTLTVSSGPAQSSLTLSGSATAGPTWLTLGLKMYNLNGGFVGIGLVKDQEPTLSTEYYRMTVNGRFNVIGNTNAFSVWSGTVPSNGYRQYVAINNLSFANGTEYSSISSYAYNTTQVRGQARHLILNNSDGNGSTGNVGIGNFTSAPTHKLTVMGNVKVISSTASSSVPDQPLVSIEGQLQATSILVPTFKWCDYVFDADYTLSPLDSVASFIEHNGHLPEVPSESEAIQNGLDLAEMNLILLKKVEELTLYLIEMKQAQNANEAKISELELQLKALIGSK